MAVLFMVFNGIYWPWLLRYETVQLTGKVEKPWTEHSDD